ncbi:metallophosphoesterase [Candidatus Enterococcus ikei]|uniref:Metallophosphoesterase n=1 Tax=Candidatus Enterococcus ikei TaxID=2815326 RepID=A0ABS3GXA2_9ENTE|nr:metallophosphoesterase [Enterococcus sp. DIV0869a]MBO0439890.1 metallophosphoesterase [Enterococcus sp. DIV0869a]
MRKKIGFILLSIIVILVAIIYFGGEKEQNEETLFKKEAIEFWVVSDPHYIDKSLTDSGLAFKKIKQTAAGKELDYQKESWQAFINKAIEQKPDMLIITGDLTLNGEKVSAEKLAELLKQLTNKGINVFVIPGNHDVNDGWARKFVEEKQEKTEAISIADFKEIFADFGYQNATNYDKHSLSYSVAVNPKYNFLFLDSNIYPEDNQPQTRPATGGTIRGKTMKWVKKQLEKAKQEKKKTLVFVHHNIYAHNKLLSSGFVLNNADDFKQVLADYQVPIVFSGHIHAQDIMTETINNQPLTEIVSSSFSIAPQGYGVVKLNGNSFDYQKQENTHSVSEIENYPQYIKELFIEDGKRLGYSQLIDAGLSDSKQLDIAAEFVGEVNYRFFSGNDFITDKEVEKIKTEAGYQIITENSKFLKEYIDSIIQDKNQEDNRLKQNFN